jgi:uncharacterized membrane protein YidH (DUF202 family)
METKDSENLIIGQIQILLAEKRTSLSTLSVGIAILALPMSVISFLIATSKHYDIDTVAGLLSVLMCMNLALVVLGVYLILRSVKKILHYDKLIEEIKREHSTFSKYLG